MGLVQSWTLGNVLDSGVLAGELCSGLCLGPQSWSEQGQVLESEVIAVSRGSSDVSSVTTASAVSFQWKDTHAEVSCHYHLGEERTLIRGRRAVEDSQPGRVGRAQVTAAIS